MLKRKKIISFILTIVLVVSITPSMVFAGTPNGPLIDYIDASAPSDPSKDPRYGQGGTGSITGCNYKIYFFNGNEIEQENGGVASSTALQANNYGYNYTIKTTSPESIWDDWDNYIQEKLDSTKTIKFGITLSGNNTKEQANFERNFNTMEADLFLPKVALQTPDGKTVLSGHNIYKAPYVFHGIVLASLKGGAARGGDIFFEIPANALNSGKEYTLIFKDGITLGNKGDNDIKYYFDKDIKFTFSTAVIKATSVKLSATKIGLRSGASKQLTATVSPSNATDRKITWSSSNPTVAKVSSTGKVTALKAGTATVTASTKDGPKSASIVYVVGNPKVSAKSISHNSVKLTWSKVANATGYKVYRYNSKSKSYKLIKTTKNRSYKDTKLKTGKKYAYKVRAYKVIDGNKAYGKYSAKKTVKVKLPAPNVRLSKSGTNIKATVSKIKGADGYVVYRTRSIGDGFIKIKTLTDGKTSFTSYNKKRGKLYTYKAKAFKIVDGKRLYSSYSTVTKIKL